MDDLARLFRLTSQIRYAFPENRHNAADQMEFRTIHFTLEGRRDAELALLALASLLGVEPFPRDEPR